ncbi:fungal-specific transcription factor domain-containing protein [Aspergillus varians]
MSSPHDPGDSAARSDSPRPATSRNRIERSCLLCHRRKIRCDKKSPCSACTRMGVLCCYPGPEKAPRRPHKTTISDVSARVARLERTVRALSHDSAHYDSHDPSIPVAQASPGTPTAAGGSPGHASGGVLVRGKYSSHYFDEILLSRVLEEEREMQYMLTNGETSDNKFSESLNISGILSSPPAVESRVFRPTKWQSTQLWQTFVNNVDPLTKILHIPTAQASVFGAISDASETIEDINALLFAIFYAATTSLEEDDVGALLGHDKRTALGVFKLCFEQSLSRVNILDNPSLLSLQALAIYLLSARAHKAGRSVWVLNGLAIRLAQSIGLHRDGKTLNLSPFDSEMRRRLWWHLWAKDSRASEDHGITVPSYDFSCDIDFPLNVDDNELDPAMSELPPSKLKWSEMTYPLIVMKANHALREFYYMAKPSSSNESNEPTRKEAVRRLTAHIEDYSRNCNPNIPIQRATMLFTRIILRKLDFVSHQQSMNQSGSKPEDRKSLATEENLVNACEILELSLQIQSDDLLRGFRWAFEAYPQYHLLLYVLWHLGVKPSGPNVDRAWHVVEASFGHESTNQRDTITVTGPKLAILEMMRNKAVGFRQTANRSDFTAPVPTEGQCNPTMGCPAHTFDLAGYGMPSDVMNWAQDSAFPDWNPLIDDFNMHRQAFGSGG